MNTLNNYFDIIAIAQQEIPLVQLTSCAMQEIHRNLSQAYGEIGIAFPKYQEKLGLGPIIRFFGEYDELDYLKNSLSSGKIKDYFIITEIKQTPIHHKIVRYQRVHHKGASKIRRTEKRLREKGTWHNNILDKLEQKIQKQKYYPHITLESSSTGQKFLLAIKKIPCKEHKQGKFNSYGLSTPDDMATVPEFDSF